MTADEVNDIGDGSSSSIRPGVVICGVFWIVSMLSNIGGTWSNLSYLGLLSVVVGVVCLQQFDEAAAVTFLFSMSEWLEDRATSRANAALTSIVKLKPETANIIQPKTKELIIVPATAVPVGAMVAVRA